MSLVAYWPFNGHARDIVGGLDPIRFSGSEISYLYSPLGKGVRFGANDDRIIIPHNDDINNRCFGKSKKFSVSFFYYPTGYLSYGCVIQKARDGSWSNTTMGVWIYNGGIRFVMGSDVSGNPPSSYTGITEKPPTDQWVHVVCIADGEQMRMYFNGDLVGTTDMSAISHPRTSNDVPITIGPRYDDNGSSSGLRGTLAGLKLYDHVLSKQEILEDGLGLMSHWSLTNPPIGGEVVGDSINTSKGSILSNTKYVSGLGGLIDSTFLFQGKVNDGIDLPWDDFKQNSQWGSVAFWFKMDDLQSREQWLWFTNLNRNRGAYINASGELVGHLHRDNDNTLVPTGKNVSIGRWYHFAMSWNISNGMIHIFLDGQVITNLDTGGWVDADNGDTFLIGTNDPSNLSIVGSIAHFKTFGQPLTTKQVKLLHDKRSSMSLEGTLNIENLDEGYDRVASHGEFLVVDSGYYGDIPIYAYKDNTELFVGGDLVATLSKGQHYLLPKEDQFIGLSISAMGKPISIGNTRNCISTRWAGKAFGVWVDRGPGEIVVFSPFSDATVEITESPFGDPSEVVNTILIPAGESHSIPNQLEYLYFIRSNVDVCVYAMGNPNDNRPIYPASKELYGIASSHAELVSLTDGNVEMMFSDGTSEDLGFKRRNSGSGNIAGGLSLYSGKSMRVSSTGLVCVNSQADSDGSEIAPFIAKDAMTTHFLLPNDCLYVAFVGLESNVEIKHFDENMVEQQSLLVDGGEDGYPSKAKLEGTLLAGHWIVCDRPMFAIMQDINSDDETVLYGYNPNVDNVYRENINKFSENGMFPQEYIAYFPLYADLGDHGPNGFNHPTAKPPVKSDRGFTFNGIDTYVMALSNQQASDQLGQPEDRPFTVALSFRSYGPHDNADSAARLISRDASDYWAIAVDQYDEFPQRLRWWDTAGAYSELSIVDAGWHRIVMTRDPESGLGKVYFNGTLIGEYNATGGVGSSRPILIGANTEQSVNNTSNAFYGDIEDVHIVEGIVSEQHVKADYQRFVKRNRSLSFDRSSKNVYQLIER